MVTLFNFLAPTLLVITFYLVMGAIVWWILHPTRFRLPHVTFPQRAMITRQSVERLSNRLLRDTISRRTLRVAVFLIVGGFVGLLMPLPLPLHLLAAQAIGAAFLLIWFDAYYQQRQKQAAHTSLLNDLRSPNAQVAHAALIRAQQLSWLTNGTLANQAFRHAQWSGAKLNDADLTGVDLSDADLSGADLRRANLRGANLQGALLATADLTGANLVGAQLVDIQAKAATFHRATCQWANLDGAKLQKANLTYANLNNTTLSQANLKQALMVGIELKDAQFNIATKWPKHLYPGLAGAKQIPPPPTSSAQDAPTQLLPEHSIP